MDSALEVLIFLEGAFKTLQVTRLFPCGW